MVPCMLSEEQPSPIINRILPVQVPVSPKSGLLFWGWKIGHNCPLNNWLWESRRTRLPNISLPLRTLLFKYSWIMTFSFLEAFQRFKLCFPGEILEPQILRCFVLFYFFLTGFVRKSDVHKLFITHPIHEYSFPFNFYESLLC